MKIAVFGGSISSQPNSERAKDFWRKELNAEVVTYGVGGMGFSRLTGEDNIQVQVERAISDGFYDIYVFWASNNDIFQQHPIGFYKDYTEFDDYNDAKLNSQSGGMNYCFKRVFETNPKAKIIFFTTLKSIAFTESSYDPFYKGGAYEYVKGQIDVCNYWGIPCLNQFLNVPLNKYQADIYYNEDNIHMTEDGYKFMGNIQAKFIANNI